MFEQFIGTKPVEDRHRIDVAALEEYLQLRVRGIEQFKGSDIDAMPVFHGLGADELLEHLGQLTLEFPA